MTSCPRLARELDAQAADRHASLVAAGEIPDAWPAPYDAAATLPPLVARADERLEEGGAEDAGYGAAPPLPGRAERAGSWLLELAAGGRRVVVTTDQASRVGELLEEAGHPAASVAELRELPQPGTIGLVHGSLSAGLSHAPSELLLLTDRELFGATRVRRLTSGKRVVTRDLIGKLQPGDHVVHVDHGIARYVGMTQRTFGEDVKEYLQLDFAGTDKIFLPADQIGRITRYSGGPAPALSRLGGTEWERTKTRVRRAVGDLARELIEIYAARESAPGFAFSARYHLAAGARGELPVHRDARPGSAASRRSRPTCSVGDRWTGWSCGDVGYGKTEVALRAAFKAVQDGKQVAVLVPTTVLAQQHLHTFERRLAAFPVRVAMLSRFVGKKEQERIVEGVAEGERRHPDRDASDPVEGHRLRRPRAARGRRGAALRRRPQGAHQVDATRGRRADALRHADPAHAAPLAGRHPRPVRDRDPAGGAPADPDPHRRGRRRAGARRDRPRARPRRAGLLRPQPGRDDRGGRRARATPGAAGRASPSATARWRRGCSSG